MYTGKWWDRGISRFPFNDIQFSVFTGMQRTDSYHSLQKTALKSYRANILFIFTSYKSTLELKKIPRATKLANNFIIEFCLDMPVQRHLMFLVK